MPTPLDEEFLVQSWNWLLDSEPYLAFRMLNTRRMLEHRKLAPEDVALYLQRSYEWAYQALRPYAIRLQDEPWRPNTLPVELALSRLDDLELGITHLTDLRGGVYGICGCSAYSVGELKNQLSGSKLVKEMFPDYG